MVSYLGILRAGMIAVPVNYKFPAEIVAFILQDSEVKLVLCDDERRADLDVSITVVSFDQDFQQMLDPGPFDIATPDDDAVAMILYTSGSTGRPKGVPLTHNGHLWALRMRTERGGPYDHHRLLVAAPLYHMNALCVSLFAYGARACVVLLPEFTPQRYAAAIERFRCTWITSVPTMLAMCMAEKGLMENTDLSSVSIVRMGSAPVSPKLWAQIEKLFPDANVVNGYGTTEAGPVVFGPSPDRPLPKISVGWPAPGVDVKLIDRDGNEAEQGNLWHRTPALMPGYLNLPEKTRETVTEDGWYISGDVFRRDENGAYFFVGRDDDMFVCGGENVYPGEVEAVLVGHPDIEQACVVAVPDEIKGEKPIAFVVLKNGAQLDEEAVKQHVLANAPAYQHPRLVSFVEHLPLAGPGKVDRKQMEQRGLDLWQDAGGR
jgi:acyl-CoA synthetase (AMP-forming)/AMP-acid ligase II